jgi:carbon monoxide dehydrogenase subunit G
VAALSMTIAREITSEPDEVWEVLANIDRLPKVLTSVMSVRRLDGPAGYEIGTRYAETRLALGSHVTEEWTVTEVVPGHRSTIEADVDGGHLVIQYRCVPSSLGTHLEVEASVTSSSAGIGQKILGSVSANRAMKGVKVLLEQDLQDIVAALRK